VGGACVRVRVHVRVRVRPSLFPHSLLDAEIYYSSEFFYKYFFGWMD
jgi:hypothetical protein